MINNPSRIPSTISPNIHSLISHFFTFFHRIISLDFPEHAFPDAFQVFVSIILSLIFPGIPPRFLKRLLQDFFFRNSVRCSSQGSIINCSKDSYITSNQHSIIFIFRSGSFTDYSRDSRINFSSILREFHLGLNQWFRSDFLQGFLPELLRDHFKIPFRFLYCFSREIFKRFLPRFIQRFSQGFLTLGIFFNIPS